MPATRIRGRVPFSVTTGGGTGTSTNPAGSSLTVDGFSIAIKAADAVATPTDNATFKISASSADTSTTPTEASTFTIKPPADTVSTPTGAHSTSILAGATTVTQTTGTGWTTPANSQGPADTTFATLNSPANVAPATVTGTLTGIFASLGTPSTETQTGTVTLTFYSTLFVPALGTGSLVLSYSTDGGANYTTAATLSATSPVAATNFNTPTSVVLTGFLLTNLANLRFKVVGSVLGTAIAATTAYNDAVVASFTTTGSAG